MLNTIRDENENIPLMEMKYKPTSPKKPSKKSTKKKKENNGRKNDVVLDLEKCQVNVIL